MFKKLKDLFLFLAPVLPYGVIEPWEDLNPKLYHAVHIYWLKFYGMWYNNYSPLHFIFWLQTVYSMCVLWLVCFLPGIGEVVYLLRRRENIGDVAEGLYLFLSEMYTYVKVAVFWYNKEKVLEMLKYLHCSEFKPVEKEHNVIYRNSIKTARFVMTYYSTMCVGAVSVGIIIPLTENFDILPTNVDYPHIDVYQSPMYEALYIHHIYYKPATCIIDGVMDTILAAFIASAIGQIEILAFNLRNFEMLAERRRKRAITAMQNDGTLTAEYYMKTVLKDCIKHHNCIIRYVSMIESAFSVASALQFMLSVMVLCLVGIQFLSIENPTSHPMQIVWMAIYLTCMLIEVFILCWFGDELIWKYDKYLLACIYRTANDKDLHNELKRYVDVSTCPCCNRSIAITRRLSMDLRLAAFEGPWLKLDRKMCMIVIIFLERCKRPLRVTAGKIFTLSLDTYTALINWSYKAFAVMRNMKK